MYRAGLKSACGTEYVISYNDSLSRSYVFTLNGPEPHTLQQAQARPGRFQAFLQCVVWTSKEWRNECIH